MEKFDKIKTELLYNNRVFLLNGNIKYVEWSFKTVFTKRASIIIVKFTHLKDANKIINEGFNW